LLTSTGQKRTDPVNHKTRYVKLHYFRHKNNIVNRGLDPSNIVLDCDPPPLSRKGDRAPPNCLLWPNGWMDQNATWHGGSSRHRPHCARGGPSSHSLKKGTHAPPRNFRLMSIVAKRLDRIKMPLGMEEGLGHGHTVTQHQPPLKGARPSVFEPCLLWPNSWMDEDATWYGDRLRRRPHCVRLGPSSPAKGA